MDAYVLALGLERAGVAFYERCLAEDTAPGARREFEFLLQEERRHVAYFEEKLQSTTAGGNAHPTENPDIMKEVLGPLQDSLKRTFSSPREVLLIGAELEKRAIDFYSDLVHSTDENQVKKDLKKILSEERRHFQKINLLLQ